VLMKYTSLPSIGVCCWLFMVGSSWQECAQLHWMVYSGLRGGHGLEELTDCCTTGVCGCVGGCECYGVLCCLARQALVVALVGKQAGIKIQRLHDSPLPA
jgi:hypothetical protein